MKIILKIVKYIAVIIIAVLLLLYLISVIFEKNISAIFVRELNKNLSTSLSTGEMNFSLIKKFPQASIEINNILVKTPEQENNKPETSLSDTMLYAGKLILSLKLTELIHKNYIIDGLDINNGIINIRKYSSGLMNTAILKKNTENDDSSFVKLNINSINISNSSFTYNDYKSSLHLSGTISNSNNNLRIEGKATDIHTNTDAIIDHFVTGTGYEITDPFPVELKTGIYVSADSILFTKAGVNTGELKLEGEALINRSSQNLSIRLETKKISPLQVSGFIPENALLFIRNHRIDGRYLSSVTIKGSYTKGAPLFMNANIETIDAGITIPQKNIRINSLNSNIDLLLDLRKSKQTFNLSTGTLACSVDGTSISGSVNIKKLDRPEIDIIITGNIPSEQITSLISVEGVRSTNGTVRLNARLNGILPTPENIQGEDLLKMHRSINLGLNSVSLTLPSLKGEISNIYGNVMIADNLWIDDLSLKYADQNIALNGMIKGFQDWLLKKPAVIDISAGLWSDKLDIGLLRKSISDAEHSNNKPGNSLSLGITLSADSLIIGNLNASLFEGNITYMPGLTDIPSFSMNTLEGSVSGNAAIADLKEEGYALRGWFDIENINIKEAFSIFNNFNQEYIKAGNLEGKISGNVSLTATADKKFRINGKNLILNGDYYIVDGRLMNFEPAYRLSSFVELDELKEIQFSRLENSLIINNEMITIPNMDIKSSAFNISLAGNHSFKGDYEYRLKVLLSEVLSRKKNEKVSEFGVVEDDGLGRTSLYLKISGDKSGSKVSHDTDALRAGLKKDIEEEKQVIKSILNEEYGWYGNDTVLPSKEGESRRFRIVWEEADSLKTEAGKSNEKKLPLIRLLRNKILKEEKSEKK